MSGCLLAQLCAVYLLNVNTNQIQITIKQLYIAH